MIRAFSTVSARPDEVAAARPGDDLVPGADVVMDRAFTLDASRESLWPWVIQLGKQRAGWYLPQSVERFVPRSRRAARFLNPAWQGLVVGDVIPDYGGRHETFEVAVLRAPSTLVYTSVRGRMSVSWSINLTDGPPTAQPGSTRLHLRLRLGHVRRPWLAESGGGLIDLLTVAGLAAGLRERVAP